MCQYYTGVGRLSILFMLIFFISFTNCARLKELDKSVVSERTQAIALLFSVMQCLPTSSNDTATQDLINLNRNFHPADYINEYSNRTDAQNLIDCIARLEEEQNPNTLPGSANPEYVLQLNYVLKVLWFNTDNWPLFYNTCVWLLGRINPAQYTWALMIVLSDKFADTVAVPAMIEIFPQLYFPKQYVLEAAGIAKRYPPENPLKYWTSDPNIHLFHVHWHIDNPWWWDESIYKVHRDRKDELFLYMHHQMICRYNAELISNQMPEVKPLQLRPSFIIQQGYIPDVVNIDFTEFFPRNDSTTLGHFDDGSTLSTLVIWNARIVEGIQRGYFKGPDGRAVPIKGPDGTDIVGSTVEASPFSSANYDFYGSIHNVIHTVLAGVYRPDLYPIPGIEASVETAMRDPVFYQIHKFVDDLYLQYKETMPAYTRTELEFRGVDITSFDILPCDDYDLQKQCRRSAGNIRFPLKETGWPTVLTTFYREDTYDISTIAKPCRSVSDAPVPVTIHIMDYIPFSYVLGVKSSRMEVTYAIARIFLWPESINGKLVTGDAASARAIELDRVRIKLEPNQINTIVINSLDSTLTRVEPSPGIKKLFRIGETNEAVTLPENRRACAFPNNLLIPKGSADGIRFKVTVFLSELTDPSVFDYPHYPLCGALHGYQFPDKKPMGYPFDRPGTKFTFSNFSNMTEPTIVSSQLKNVVDKIVVIRHEDQIKRA